MVLHEIKASIAVIVDNHFTISLTFWVATHALDTQALGNKAPLRGFLTPIPHYFAIPI